MRAVCSHCGKEYEFDAAAIPPEGYQAQCVACQQVFFVAPAAAPGMLRVACTHCGKVYEFAADSIPAGGYQAQCTDCHQVFPVPGAAAGSPAGASASGPVEPAGAAELSRPRDEPPDDGADAEAAETEAGQDGLDDDDPGALAAEPGAGSPGSEGDDLDFEAQIKIRRRRLLIGVGVPGALTLLTVLMYLVTPRLFDLTVGRLVGIKAAIIPAAIELADQAYPKFCKDTEADYAEAATDYLRSLAIDGDYPESAAFGCLSLVFMGHAIRQRGQAIFDQGNELVTQINELDARHKKRKVKDYERLRAELHGRVVAANEQAGQLFSLAGRQTNTGFQLLQAREKAMLKQPRWLQAYGIYHTLDVDHLPKAEQALRNLLILDRRDPKAPIDLADPPDQWTLILYGMTRALTDRPTEQTRATAIAALTKALDLNAAARRPDLPRVRLVLARVLADAGKPGEAQAQLDRVLASAPAHPQAAALRARLAGPAPAGG